VRMKHDRGDRRGGKYDGAREPYAGDIQSTVRYFVS
jgi:hypothetical protein